ncbi:MAG: hypothetical protein IJY85_02915 [Ruminococcus sp.]|nr:hypothetical protein [Ruminococcus sp.]
MLYDFGKFRLDVDIESTKAFYFKHGKTVLEDCGCVSCRNYYEAISEASDKVNSFFHSIGIDPQKSPEVTWCYTDENGIAYYSAIYHIVGTIIQSVDIYKRTEDNCFKQIIENFYEIDKDFKVGFTSEIILLEKDFPKPCIQLEIEAYLPWVID